MDLESGLLEMEWTTPSLSEQGREGGGIESPLAVGRHVDEEGPFKGRRRTDGLLFWKAATSYSIAIRLSWK